jgi:predicted nuclease of predicted toxin-antitoxin system
VTAGPAATTSPPRLLFDENLAPSLPQRISDLYPGSAHVRDLGLAAADDEEIWLHARVGGYVIVTKDDDFRQRSFLRGAPPKVLWTKLGNCSTADVERALRGRHATIVAFAEDNTAALLVIAGP